MLVGLEKLYLLLKTERQRDRPYLLEFLTYGPFVQNSEIRKMLKRSTQFKDI